MFHSNEMCTVFIYFETCIYIYSTFSSLWVFAERLTCRTWKQTLLDAGQWGYRHTLYK